MLHFEIRKEKNSDIFLVALHKSQENIIIEGILFLFDLKNKFIRWVEMGPGPLLLDDTRTIFSNFEKIGDPFSDCRGLCRTFLKMIVNEPFLSEAMERAQQANHINVLRLFEDLKFSLAYGAGFHVKSLYGPELGDNVVEMVANDVVMIQGGKKERATWIATTENPYRFMLNENFPPDGSQVIYILCKCQDKGAALKNATSLYDRLVDINGKKASGGYLGTIIKYGDFQDDIHWMHDNPYYVVVILFDK